MATAEEILQTMAETYAETDKILTIDNDLRTITIPPGLTNIGVESDDGVHRLHFRMPRQYGEFDLSEFDIRINYLNANNEGDKYAVLDKSAEEDYIDFSWLVGRHALAYRGNVTFIVCLRKSEWDTVEKEFNTTVATLPVLEGLETTEQVTQEYPDALEEILRRLDDLEENGGGGSGSPGKDGVGIKEIKKTNTSGLVDTYTITLTDNRSYTFTVTNGAKGEKGDKGDKGDPGKDGITPTIGENGNWYLGEEDTGKPSRGEKGNPGDKGNPGEKGDPGPTGATPNIQIGTVQTLEPGQQATASMSGTPENPVLNLGIPKGEKGDPGEASEGDPYTLPIMSSAQLGGGKAVEKTDEDVPVAVDPSTGQLFVPTYPESTGGETINVDAELKEYMNVAKPAIASAIINKGGNVEPDDSLGDYATRISEIPNDVYPAETLPEQTNLSASGLQDSVGIKLNWSNVNASGYLIVRKENAMPTTSADGDIVYNGTYAVDGYTDTGVQKGKVYYYRIFPRNSKNQYQSLEDGAVAMVDYKDRTGQTLLGDLPLGTKIKFGQWNGSDFFWEVVDTQDKASGFVTVAADQNLGNRQFDAPETNNPITNRKSQGNNRWAYSAARQLLNSDQDSDLWWTAQHEYDVAPSYATSIPGFLKDFTEYEKDIIVTKTNRCNLDTNDGGGSETVQDKVWLPSSYAMGLELFQPLEDEHTYEKYTSNAERAYQSNYWLRTINGSSSASGVRVVLSNGILNGNAANFSLNAVRPFCQLPTSAYMTWSDSEEAYVFADDSQRNHSA